MTTFSLFIASAATQSEVEYPLDVPPATRLSTNEYVHRRSAEKALVSRVGACQSRSSLRPSLLTRHFRFCIASHARAPDPHDAKGSGAHLFCQAQHLIHRQRQAGLAESAHQDGFTDWHRLR